MSNYTIADLNEKCNVDDNGVYRWKSSNNVVPGDILKNAGFTPEELRVNAEAHSAHAEAFMRDYVEAQRNRSPEQVAEDRFEARAAMGTGVEMVNVITGEKWTT